jgi:predicted methyltransferase
MRGAPYVNFAIEHQAGSERHGDPAHGQWGCAASCHCDRRQRRRAPAATQRSAENKARDRYRNPLPVLTFLKVTPTARVVELLPGSAGYWTEILAPYLKDGGHYTAAIPKPNPERAEIMKAIADTKAKYAADPGSYGRVATVDFSSADPQLGAPASVDFVLTFRNLHNWMAAGKAEVVIAAMHTVLRPGGILGIEEHRGRTDQPQDPLAKSGYVREDYTIALIEKAGFKLVAKSEVNANPKDTKDYPSGVWTLPPTYRLKDQDRDKYSAIGESDRFMMMFEKQ